MADAEKKRFRRRVGESLKRSASGKQRWLAFFLLRTAVGGDDLARHAVSAYATGKASSREWTDAEVLAWIATCDPEPDPENPGRLRPSVKGVARVQRLYHEALEAEGQKRLL